MLVRVLQWICRLALAAIFLYAGFVKAGNRFRFEMDLSTYQLLPDWGVIAVAAMLPWLEMALGAVLILGWKQRYVTTFTALLLGAFMAVMGITYARGIEAQCGCFGFGEPISPTTLARDSVFFLMAVFLAVVAWRRRPAPEAAPGP